MWTFTHTIAIYQIPPGSYTWQLYTEGVDLEWHHKNESRGLDPAEHLSSSLIGQYLIKVAPEDGPWRASVLIGCLAQSCDMFGQTISQFM